MKFRQKHLKSFDGTRIGYQVAGRGRDVFLLCNGLGGSAVAWTPLTKRFGNRFRFITWDYRGLFTSEVPKNRATLALPYHVMDAEMILEKEKVRRAIVGGWSMGVQVALELHRRKPALFKGLFLINGTAGYPLKTAFNSPLTRYVVPLLNAGMKRLLPTIQPRLAPVAKRVIQSREFISAIVGLGLIHRGFNTTIFRRIADDILHTDLAVYHEVMDHLCVHDAWDVLPKVRAPALVVAGGRDILTPKSVAERIVSLLPRGELFIVPKGSHYCLIEFPASVNRRVERFLADHGLGRGRIRRRHLAD